MDFQLSTSEFNDLKTITNSQISDYLAAERTEADNNIYYDFSPPIQTPSDNDFWLSDKYRFIKL